MPEPTISVMLPQWEERHLAIVCGIANAGGGTIVIASNPSGRRRGMDRLRKTFETIPALTLRELGLTCTTEPVMNGMELCLEVSVPAAEEPVCHQGNYYLYTYGENRLISGEEVEHLYNKNASAAWEERLQPFAREDDIDAHILPVLLQQVAEQTGERSASPESIRTLLQQYGMKSRQSDAFTNIGVLLLHRSPELYIPGAFVTIKLFDAKGSEQGRGDTVTGPLTTQLARTLELLAQKYLPAALDAASADPSVALPQEALHEGLLNALVHKDYESEMPVKVSVFPDRVYIDNVGRPPAGWTKDDLLERHNSRPHNPGLALALQRHRMFNGWGMGVGTMMNACRNAGLPEPEITLRADEMDVCFRLAEAAERGFSMRPSQKAAGNKEGSERIAAPTPRQSERAGRESGPRPTFKERSVAAANRLDMTSTDEYILKVIETNGRVTAMRIAEVLGVSESTVRRSFRRLREYGFIERIGSDKAGYWRLMD